MNCPRCQHANPPPSKFCQECGSRLASRCPACGTEIPGDSKFCNECGQAVGALSPAGADPAARFASPDTYVPKHLAERILTSKSSLEGERKQVTVLFADLKGSMELMAERDPEEARRLLDPIVERMMEAVHRYEGTVNQVMGDGIMALFGAPISLEDHAIRACYAALRMQETVKRYAEEIHESRGIPISIRVGLNSGDVVVRSIGSDLRMDYTAVGQTTHLAARMEQMATPGSILMPRETFRLVEGFVIAKPLGPRPVKGLDDPVEVYEVLGAGTVRSRLQVSAARGLTPFVGRAAELEQLCQALERARAGHGEVVAVIGEPGVGKSRLYWEFTHSAQARDWRVVESRSVSYGRATAYLPLIDLLKSYFEIEARDDVRKIREKVTGKLLPLDRALEPFRPALLWLLDVPVDDTEWPMLTPPQRRQRTLEGVKRLLLRESTVQPLLILFEDLHWIDAETQALLDGLVESLPMARVLLLVNYRPEYQHGWGSKSCYRQLRIDPLSAGSAEGLLRTLLGDDPSLEPLKRLLIARTEGNPFFLEESVRTLVETGILAGERGAYRVTKAPERVQLPPTAQAVLAARIDRLRPEDKRLLQAAAVIGKDVPWVLLRAVADEGEENLRDGLARLRAAEFLYETRLFPDLEYTFRHALTHEVAYGGLLQDRRRALHARIVEVMERLYADRLVEYTEQLAQHAVRGEIWDEAVPYLRRAGAKAFDRSANRDAVAWFDQALGILKRLPESHATVEQVLDLCFDLRGPLQALGEFERLLDSLREAERLARTLGDQRRLGRALGYLTQFFILAGEHRRAIESGQRTLVIAEEIQDLELQVVANFNLGLLYLHLGDYPRAIEFHGRNTARLEGLLTRERFGLSGPPAIFSRTWLAWSFAEQGRFGDGIACGEEGLRIAEEAKSPYGLIYADCGLGYLYLRRGDSDTAMHVLERGLGLCDATDIRVLFPYVAAMLGAAYAVTGRMSDALPLLERGVEAATSIKLAFGRSLLVGFLSEAYLLAGRVRDASERAAQALDLSREHEERGYEAWTLRLLGEIAARRTPADADGAVEAYERATGLAGKLGMRPLVARCHLGLGTVYRRTGRPQEASEHLQVATALFREMEMRP